MVVFDFNSETVSKVNWKLSLSHTAQTSTSFHILHVCHIQLSQRNIAIHRTSELVT